MNHDNHSSNTASETATGSTYDGNQHSHFAIGYSSNADDHDQVNFCLTLQSIFILYQLGNLLHLKCICFISFQTKDEEMASEDEEDFFGFAPTTSNANQTRHGSMLLVVSCSLFKIYYLCIFSVKLSFISSARTIFLIKNNNHKTSQ